MTQGEEYTEDEVAPKPKAKSRKPSQEDVDMEDTEEEEEAEEQKTGGLSLSLKTKACIVGIVVILILVGGLIIFLSGNKSQVEREEESRAVEESLSNLPIPETDNVVDSSDSSTDLTVPMDTQQSTGLAYNDKTVAALRKWGYTLNEMEIASRDGLSADALVEAAKKARKEATWETMQSLMDSTSEDYQNLCAKTWLGQAPIDVSAFNSDVIYLSEQYTSNVDFEKIESRGTQLWLKCYLKDGNVLFLQVTPQRYNQLPDSGNIVISYSIIREGDTYVVTEAKEVEVES